MTTRIAYLVSRFPHLTETFIVNEIRAIEQHGLEVDLYALVRHSDEVVQPDAAALIDRVTYGASIGWRPMVRAQLHWFRRDRRRWWRCWTRSLWGNRRSPKFLLRALIVVPVAMAFAVRIEADGVDRIHAHWATHPALAAHVIWILTGIEYSVTVHAHDLYVDRSMLGEKLGAAVRIITISDYNRRLIVDSWPDLAERTRVIHCGIDTLSWSEQARTAPRADPVPTLLAVGSLQPYKGHVHLIDACAHLRDRGVAHRCVIVGRGELEGELRERIERRDLSDTVRLAGPRTSAEVQALMRDAAVFVHPSVVTSTGKTEGIPVAVMEALASGLPVVASDVTGMGELVIDGRTGLLVGPGDAAALADAVERILTDPDAAHEMGRAGCRHVSESFDIERSTVMLLEELEPATVGR